MSEPHRKLRISRVALLDALGTSHTDPLEHYLDLETGEILQRVVLDDELGDEEVDPKLEDDPDRYLEIEPYGGHRTHDLMSEYADAIDEPDLRIQAQQALRGRGAFSRFFDFLRRYPDLRAEWERQRDQTLLDYATRWLRDHHDIEPIYDPPLPAPPPRPPSTARGPRQTAAKPARIQLVHVLLLGAPDGKTELVDGRVVRLLPARRPEQARQYFRTLARDLCDLRGEGWRNRFVEGKSAFQLDEEISLTVTPEGVEVSVAVPPEVWKAFE